MKTFKSAILFTVVGAAALLSASCKQGKDQVSFETTFVQICDIASSVPATGTIEPVTEVEIGTQVSGIIDKILVDYNTEVKKGQLIALMDMVTLKTDLQSSQASYEGNKVEYEYQEKTFNRTKALYEKGLVSDEEYDQAEYNYKRAAATLKASEAELAKAERNLDYAYITSPIDGVVIEKSVEEGQTVAAGYSTPTLFYIAADLTKMRVIADVDEADIGGVEVGQRVFFTVDAYPDDTFEGRVEQIRLGSSLDDSSSSTVVTYEVVITADNDDLKLLPRLTANIEIYVVDRMGVVGVASKALRFTPSVESLGEDAVIRDCAGSSKLWTKEGNVFTAHPVEIGITNGVSTEIISGAQPGLEVISKMNVVSSKKEKVVKTASSPFMPTPPGRDNGAEEVAPEEE